MSINYNLLPMATILQAYELDGRIRVPEWLLEDLG